MESRGHVFFAIQWIFAILQPSGNFFPSPVMLADSVGVDHHGIGEDHFNLVARLTDGDKSASLQTL